MNEEVKLCELCGMHRKLNINPAGAVWLEKDGAGDALLVVEPVVGRTLPVAVPVWFCPACGRDFRPHKEDRKGKTVRVTDESWEYLKEKAAEMEGNIEDALDAIINTSYWADKEKEQEAGTNDETST